MFDLLKRFFNKQEEKKQTHVISCDGRVINADDDVIVGLPTKTHEGVGKVLKLDPEKNMALIQFYPWLSPHFRHGVNWYPGQMLRIYDSQVEES